MDSQGLLQELKFKASRSGGKGGQHVNKVSFKVLLIWDLFQSSYFDDNQKQQIAEKLANRINKDGNLLIESSEDRSQFKNKENVIERFFDLLSEALKTEKPRLATKIPKSIVLDRLNRKKKQSDKKANRNWKFD